MNRSLAVAKAPAEEFTIKTASEGLQGNCINLYCWILCEKDESCPIGHFIFLATSSGLTVATFQPPDKRTVFGQLPLQNLCGNEDSSQTIPTLELISCSCPRCSSRVQNDWTDSNEWQASPNNWGAVYVDFPWHPSQRGTHLSTDRAAKASATLWGTMAEGESQGSKPTNQKFQNILLLAMHKIKMSFL